ncbi:hypothetical protein L6452_20827 [Arctium lappa]|uniref:Uncharacterized protein n=1 Tax=Arctium lappa TaxID=4217 RepID=A0ACB9BDR7_ARCLA|nr:hypothetical protein L6452_20827 [Arctium lappa]
MRPAEPLKLPNHLFFCLELKSLKLRNCCLHPVLGFHCFPKLLSLEFHQVTFDSCKYGEFITRCCPLLENLEISSNTQNGEVKLGDIAKLVNLKMFSLELEMLGDYVVTSSDIIQLVGSLPKLENLNLNFGEYETLKMTHATSWAPDYLEVPCSIKGILQLQYVEFGCLCCEENELCFIESVLAYSPLLKKMVIEDVCDCHYEDDIWSLPRKLLKLHRASPIAEIHFC